MTLPPKLEIAVDEFDGCQPRAPSPMSTAGLNGPARRRATANAIARLIEQETGAENIAHGFSQDAVLGIGRGAFKVSIFARHTRWSDLNVGSVKSWSEELYA